MNWRQLTSEEVGAWNPQKILICTTDGEDLAVNALSEITAHKSEMELAGIKPDDQGRHDNLEAMDWWLKDVSGNKLQVIFIDGDGLPFKPVWPDSAPPAPL